MSFYHALSGIWQAMRQEKNLRFHFVIGNLIAVFAACYGINKTEWAVLILMAAAVFSAELLNTAVERAVDTATTEITPTAKLSKDAAAGAVLVLAAAALLVGVCLFGDIKRIGDTLAYIFTSPKILIPSLILGISDIIFLVFGGKNDK